MGDKVDGSNTKRGAGINPFRSIFMHADATDILLMTLGLVGSIGDGFSTPVMLFINSKVMNNLGAGPSSDPDQFKRTVINNVVNYLYLSTASFCVCFLEGYCWTRTGQRQASRMRHKYLKAVLRQNVGYFDLKTTSTFEMVNSVSNDTLLIQDVIGEKVPNCLMNLSMFLASNLVAFVLMWRLAIVGFPFSLLLIMPGLLYGRFFMRSSRKMREEYNKASSIVEQAISSIRTVYSFVGEISTMTKFSGALQASLRSSLKQGLVKGITLGSNGLVFAIWAFMSWYSSRLIMHHPSGGGTIFAVGVMIIMGGISLGGALSQIKNLMEACSAGERIMKVLKEEPDIDTYNMEGNTLPSVSGNIEFKSINFAYPSRPDSTVLQDFNLKVPAGKTVALVGGSGSGKSTVIALLERFYDPISGYITLDGFPIEELQLKWLRSQMGLVSQEPVLFETSIQENIIFGKEDATFEEVLAAARASNAHDFISQLPQGYHSQVGERGIQMSGGQKQRIAIARAIIKAPRILLLDEATSALDTESERTVQEALDNASVNQTTLVIAHRLSTVRNADIIVVIQNGQVIETGSHDELTQYDNGVYSALVQLQEIKKTKKQEKISIISACSPSHITNGGNNLSSRRPGLVSHSSSGNSVRETSMKEDTNKEEYPALSFRRLLLLNTPEWKQACLGCTSAILMGAVQPIQSFMMGSMISIYFLTNREEIQSKTRMYSLTFLGLAVFSVTVTISQHYNFAVMGEHLTKRIRERMFSKILTFELGWYDQGENSSGAVCSRLARDASAVRSLVGDRLSLLLQTFSAVTLAATLSLIISWRLAVVSISIQPLIIMCFYTHKAFLQRMSSKAIASQDESSKLASEAVSNFRTVTAFSSQSRILEMLDRAQDGPRRESIRQSWFAGIVLGVARGLTACNPALVYWYGGKLMSQDHITAKEIFQTYLILQITAYVIADAGSMTTDIAKSANTVKSVFAVLDRYTQIDSEDPEGHRPQKLGGHIELKDVHFAYPTRADVLVLKGFTISIEAGQSMALVGPSGSGKSTIISLIERFYDPLEGTVSIDRRDVRSYHLRSLRRHIALVSQEPTLFSGTIRENIEYGLATDVDEAEIINAAKTANAHDFISGLQDGYDTWCGDRGMQLSGGQKQRIAIARAMLINPMILLLDEATSALDTESEKQVQEALERAMVGRTSVIVAHRLTTIQNCDMIAVMDKGAVVEKGSHSSLIGKGSSGVYYGLVNIQEQKAIYP